MKLSKLEVEAQRRIAQAIRAHAKARRVSHNELADEWKLPPSTLDALVGSERSPRAANIPRGKLLQLIAQRTGYSLDYLLGLSSQPFRDVTVPKAELEKDLHAYVKAEIVRRGVRPHAAEVLLPDAQTLLAEIVTDYAESIDRLDIREIRRQRQATAKGILSELERNKGTIIEELRKRAREFAQQNPGNPVNAAVLGSDEPFSRQLLRRSIVDVEKMVAEDLAAMYAVPAKLVTGAEKRGVSETSTGVAIWTPGFGEDLPIRQRSADHEHAQERIEAMRAKLALKKRKGARSK